LSSSTTSLSPKAKRIAAADLYGSTAGHTVKRLSKAVDVKTCPRLLAAEGFIDVIACEVDVREIACMISCFSFVYECSYGKCVHKNGKPSSLLQKRASLEKLPVLGARKDCVEQKLDSFYPKRVGVSELL
jgi:hypothetical protein